MSLATERQARFDSADGRAIRQVIDKFVAAFSRGDVEAIRPLFAADAAVYPSNDRDRIGWDDIAEYWAPPFSALDIALNVDLVDVTIDRELAVVEMVTHARVRPRAGGDELQRRYRDMVVLKRYGAEWRIYRNLSQAHPEIGNA